VLKKAENGKKGISSRNFWLKIPLFLFLSLFQNFKKFKQAFPPGQYQNSKEKVNKIYLNIEINKTSFATTPSMALIFLIYFLQKITFFNVKLNF
jgi:hypothetical protein